MFAHRRELNEAEQEKTYGAQNSALATRRELLTPKVDHLTRVDPNMGMIVTMRTLESPRRSTCRSRSG